jgi:RimJ/RimL family protein N-acetyltransferase
MMGAAEMPLMFEKQRSAVELQQFGPDDFDRLINWIDSRETLIDWAAIFFSYPLTREQLAEYIVVRGLPRKRIYRAVDPENGKVIGHIELSNILPGLSGFVSRVLIGEESYRGKGYGEAMVRQAVSIAFTEFACHRLDLGVLDTNLGAIGVYQRIGFQHVGQWDGGFKTDEGALTVRWMTLLRSEWESTIQ